MTAEAWYAAIAAPFVGSFLGLLSDRLPRGTPVLIGRSRCACGRALPPQELIPVVSWLVLRGRCAGCGTAIGVQPLAIELLALAAVLWAAAIMPPELLIPSCALGWLLLVLAAIDLRALLLPDILTLPLALGGLAVHAWLWQAAPWDQLIGAAVGFLAFAATATAYRRWRGREGLGGGDARLLAAGGAWVGWQGLPTVVLVAALLGIATAWIQGGGRLDRAAAIPFGPALAGAIWLVWLYGPLSLG